MLRETKDAQEKSVSTFDNDEHLCECIIIRALAKLLQWHYKNVYDDVKLLEQIELIEKTKEGLFSVPWDEVTATFRLAA